MTRQTWLNDGLFDLVPDAAHTLANRMKAFWNFNRVPFQPGVDARRLDRQLAVRAIVGPTLAIEDPQWRQSHAMQMAGRVMSIPTQRHVRAA